MKKNLRRIIVISTAALVIAIAAIIITAAGHKDIIDLSFIGRIIVTNPEGKVGQAGNTDTPINKQWKLKLNHAIDDKYLRRFELKDSKGKKADAVFKLDSNDKSIIYIDCPKEGYEYGETYNLYVKTVRSRRYIFMKVYKEFSFETAELDGIIRPVDGKITKKNSADKSVIIGTDGVKGVYSTLSGVVEKVSQGNSSGEIIIDHKNGLKSIYTGVKYIRVKANEKVDKGQIIGQAAQDNLKFQMAKNNVRINPLKYLKYDSTYKYIIVDSSYELHKSAGGSGIKRYVVKGKAYKVLEEKGQFYKVKAGNQEGYIPKGDFALTDYVPDNKIVVGWNYINNKAANAIFYNDRNYYINKPSEGTGIDVISPTWMYIKGNKSDSASINLGDKGSLAYVRAAHNNGYEVWALLSNVDGAKEIADENTNARTKLVMSDDKVRARVISSVVKYAEDYDLDGINLDFEGFGQENRDLYSQFVKDLSEKLRAKGIPLSVDVTPIEKTSVMFSMCYDRKTLSQYADYMMLMAYDEHYKGGISAGSVGSYSWVKNSVKGLIEEGVPANKLLLGMPLYGSDFVVDASGKPTGSSVRTLSDMQQLINNYKDKLVYDKAARQYYLSYTDNSTSKSRVVYMEDKDTLTWRTNLSKEFDLKGIASWELYRDGQSTQTMLQQVFKNYLAQYRIK